MKCSYKEVIFIHFACLFVRLYPQFHILFHFFFLSPLSLLLRWLLIQQFFHCEPFYNNVNDCSKNSKKIERKQRKGPSTERYTKLKYYWLDLYVTMFSIQIVAYLFIINCKMRIRKKREKEQVFNYLKKFSLFILSFGFYLNIHSVVDDLVLFLVFVFDPFVVVFFFFFILNKLILSIDTVTHGISWNVSGFCVTPLASDTLVIADK